MEAANITGMRYGKKSYMHTVVCVCVYACACVWNVPRKTSLNKTVLDLEMHENEDLV